MKTKQFLSLILSFLLVLGCLTAPAEANAIAEAEAEAAIARAYGRFEADIPGNSISPVGDSFILDRGGIISYDCTYSPRDATVKFGYIGPDGLFYGLSGYKGSIDKGIQVSQRGTYTLAIWNKSDETVTVEGSVNY